MFKLIKENAGWLNIVATLIFAILVLWLNSRYVTRAEYEAHTSKDEIRQTEYIKTINRIDMSLNMLAENKTTLSDHEIRIRSLEKTATADHESRLKVLEEKIRGK